MTSEQAAGLIKKSVQESNRHPVLACADAGGLPQMVVLPFAHLNRNLSLILLLPEDDALTELVRGQHWIEVQFHTQNHHCFVRFGGRAFVNQLESARERLLEGYPFLKPALSGPQAARMALVQLHSQIIGIEVFESDSLWYSQQHFRVQNGAPEPIDAAEVGEVQAQGAGQLDTVRRIITHNRGEMIHCIVVNKFEDFAVHIAESFEPPEERSVEEWTNDQWKLYKAIDPARMSFNWGVNGFELKRDGSVECRFFLEISDGGKKRIIQQQETWVLENAAWKLFRVL